MQVITDTSWLAQHWKLAILLSGAALYAVFRAGEHQAAIACEEAKQQQIQQAIVKERELRDELETLARQARGKSDRIQWRTKTIVKALDTTDMGDCRVGADVVRLWNAANAGRSLAD